MTALIKGFCRAVVLLLLASGNSVLAQRAVPDDNLAYPVLLTAAKKLNNNEVVFGSGFYLSTSTAVYFVTAKHVLFDPANGDLMSRSASLLSYSRDPKESQDNLLVLDLDRLKADGRISAHPNVDGVVIKIASFGTAPKETNLPTGSQWLKTVEGVKFIRSSPSGILGVALGTMQKYDTVLVGNDVIVYGYPNSIGIQNHPQIDPVRPLMRKGIIAGLNPTRRSIIIDLPVFPGNSGGPVIQVTNDNPFQKSFKLIGIVSEFVPFENTRWLRPELQTRSTVLNSSYSVVVPIDFVFDLTDIADQDHTGSTAK